MWGKAKETVEEFRGFPATAKAVVVSIGVSILIMAVAILTLVGAMVAQIGQWNGN